MNVHKLFSDPPPQLFNAEPAHASRPTWIEINSEALANNVQQLRTYIDTSVRMVAVVKGNAYGHGAVDVAQTVLQAGADSLAVAALNEAIELRQASITAPILVLGYTPPHQASSIIEHDITPTVYDLDIVRALNDFATSERPARVHVKVNTGMNRLGLRPSEVIPFIGEARTLPHIEIEGVFTHFSTSDEFDKSFARQQLAHFQRLVDDLDTLGWRPPVAHAANSAAVLTLPDSHFDAVRTGIALYGLHPDPAATRLPDNFRAALAWKAQVTHTIELQAGDAVSYGREFIAQKPTTVAVIPVGYADGFPRAPAHWQSVLVHGHCAPILGRVCMDQTIVDITECIRAGQTVCQGDEVVLIGRQGAAEITVDDAAQRVGTNNYDIVSRILARVPRLFLHSEQPPVA